MSARQIFDHAPLGSILRYSHGSPRPPERHRKKLADWERRNSGGRLIRKQAEAVIGESVLSANFTLHKGDFGKNSTILVRVIQTFSIASALSFTIVERPAIGSVLVLDKASDEAELLYLAASRADAAAWVSKHPHPNAIMVDVSADEAAADAIEGRAAA